MTRPILSMQVVYFQNWSIPFQHQGRGEKIRKSYHKESWATYSAAKIGDYNLRFHQDINWVQNTVLNTNLRFCLINRLDLSKPELSVKAAVEKMKQGELDFNTTASQYPSIMVWGVCVELREGKEGGCLLMKVDKEHRGLYIIWNPVIWVPVWNLTI